MQRYASGSKPWTVKWQADWVFFHKYATAAREDSLYPDCPMTAGISARVFGRYDAARGPRDRESKTGWIKGKSSMSSVIEFLEKIGSDSHWHSAPREDIEQALGEMDIEEPLRSAILDKDAGALRVLMHQTPSFGAMVPAMPDEEEEGENPAEDPAPKDARSSSVSSSPSNA